MQAISHMQFNSYRDDVDRILMALSEEIGVSESRYQEAKAHYAAVGKWLDADNSALKPYQPQIYPQGSFALGTAIRPLEADEYDVDTVCLLRRPPAGITQQTLKAIIGNRLEEHATYAGMIDPQEGGRRCWTLRYADGSQFHLDILPAIPDNPQRAISMGVPSRIAESAIQITDKTTWNDGNDWPKSNPTGYAVWFTSRMQAVLLKAKENRARQIRASVTAIQDYEVRTPLQRAVQLLKRHRDIRFSGDEDKPISVIITTLAARVYQNEATLFDTLLSIVPKMRSELEQGRRANDWWVPNPVNPGENFADKWKETPRKAQVFLDWLDTVEQEFAELLSEEGYEAVGDYLTKAYGARDASQAMTSYAEKLQKGSLGFRTGSRPRPLPHSIQDLITFQVPHRQAPHWPEKLTGRVTVSAQWKTEACPWRPLQGAGAHVMRNGSIRFHATTTVPKPYDVYWQVVNTGEDARRANGLRGGIFSSKDPSDPLNHSESTLYRGRHWVECFIVKYGWCVAHSGPFIVNII